MMTAQPLFNPVALPSFFDPIAAVGAANGVVSVLPRQPDEEKRSDSELAAAASFALFWLTSIPQENVHIGVHDGCVSLQGFLDTTHQKQFIEGIVRRVNGVRAVVNLIKTD